MDNLLVLAGSSLPLPEQDDPDQLQLGNEASIEYDGMELVDSIGTPEFKETYFLVINDIKNQEIVDQRRICLNILKKIKEVYEYSFLPYPELDNQMDMNNVYDLIKFLNYDYMDIFGDIWRYLRVDLKKLDVKKFCEKNSDKIIIELEDQLNSRDLSEMVSLFLRTYNKYNLIDWFIKSTEKNKMLIYLRSMEEL
jgi:hypothetical protein